MKAKLVVDHLIPQFIEAMRDIGRHGFDKYGEQSFEARASHGDTSRGTGSVAERTTSTEIAKHAAEHFRAGNAGELHDKFGTVLHHYAASAFNAMMEAWFSGCFCHRCGSLSIAGICQNYGCEGQ